MTVSRKHPEAIKPLLDVDKAGISFIMCDDARCTGQCDPADLQRMEIPSNVTCGPHRGTCFAGGDATLADDPCLFLQLYGEGNNVQSAVTGFVTEGPVELGGVRLEKMNWGAIVGEDADLLNTPQGGGLLGLAPVTCSALPFSCFPSFIDQLAEERGVPKTIAVCGNTVRCARVCVSLCEWLGLSMDWLVVWLTLPGCPPLLSLRQPPPPLTCQHQPPVLPFPLFRTHARTQNEPVLVLGGVDDRLHDGPVTYAPIMGRPNRYDVAINNATLGGGTALPVPRGVTATIDTGSNFCHVPPTTHDAFKAALQTPALCDALPGVCPEARLENSTIFDDGVGFRYTPAELARFPPLRLQVHGHDGAGKDAPLVLEFGPEHYMVKLEDEGVSEEGGEMYLLALHPSSDGNFLIGQAVRCGRGLLFCRLVCGGPTGGNSGLAHS